MPIDQIVDAFLKLASEHGIFTALVLMLILSHYWVIFWLIKQLIKS